MLCGTLVQFAASGSGLCHAKSSQMFVSEWISRPLLDTAKSDLRDLSGRITALLLVHLVAVELSGNVRLCDRVLQSSRPSRFSGTGASRLG